MKNNTISVLSVVQGVFALIVGLCVLTAFSPAYAEEPEGLMDVNLSVKPEPLAQDVESGIDHLFKVLKGDDSMLAMNKIQPMLDFVVNMQDDPKDIAPAKRFKGYGVCLRQEVHTDLDRILRYFYNPAIPNYLLCPAVLRLSGWQEDSPFLAREKGLWEELPTLNEPVITRGREFETNTPDSFAEAYYAYDLNRLIILLKHQGKNVLVSVTEQDGKSDVGRKGAILNDTEWDYFYSGLEGLNKGMIGWMDTFMYSSGSVQIFVEHDQADMKSSVFLFKWLNAGWAGMNVVKRSHIYDGSLRYARSFKKVVESEDLTPEAVVLGMAGVVDMSDIEMDVLIRQYAKNFETRFKNDPKLKSGDYAAIIADGGYAKVLDKEGRRSVLALEKLKNMLGMETLVTIGSGPVARKQVPALAPAEVEASVVEETPEG
ncbi:hypothetical protein [uncultured Pseudodesulfovibrio sp.]|uniref:hypothetical protein n=1 Tax=uncultured Pseudodesulfovibrio sp. TaxID=2035858 RepID=UPI0029C7B249|nr:hypothetical protein [uncultured Pseudodesulfovibrio sp.]